jgi:ATP-dependent helicase/nuclease subunit A
VAKQLLRDAADADSLRAEAEAVIDAPDLAHLFGPDTLAEVEVVAPLFALGGATLSGTIDRLVVEPDRVLAVDFKSNAAVPDTPEQVPDGLLRQMGAYAAALALIYPGRRIETALLWTRTATLMPLPEALTRAALAAAHETVSRVPAP